MAVHNYARSTEDIDLATAVMPSPILGSAAEELRTLGYDAEYIHPDADDPLGGMIRITLEEDVTVDVVNFLNPWTVGAEPIVRDALPKGTPLEAYNLKVVPLAHLIGLKLYAGGSKSRHDVLELLRANPELDRKALRSFLAEHGLAEALDAVVGAPDDPPQAE